MSWIGWIIIGGLAGWIGNMIMKRDGSLFKNIVIGIFGAVIGGWLFSLIGADGFGDASWVWSLFVAVVGAVVVLGLVGFIQGGATHKD